jgi:hypothetical protein
LECEEPLSRSLAKKLFALCRIPWLFFSVLGTIQLDNQLRFRRIKVCNILSKYFLAGEAGGMSAKEVIPQMTFRLRHFLSQPFSEGDKAVIMLMLHDNPSVKSCAFATSLCTREASKMSIPENP